MSLKDSLHRIAISVIGLLVPLSLFAQDTIMLDAVEVNARALTPAIEKQMEQRIDSLLMRQNESAPVSELLMKHSPVFIKTYGPGGLSTASFRGTTASHTLVLWNGFQLNPPTMGQVDFSTIPVFMSDDISLKWGSMASENSGGLGGVVNIDNNCGFGKGLFLSVKQSVGSFNTFGSYVVAGFYGKRVSFRVKAYRNSSDNDFEYENVALIPHSTMKQQNAGFADFGVMPELHVLFKHGVISLVSWNQTNDRNLPPIMPNVLNRKTTEWSKDSFSRNCATYSTYWSSGAVRLKVAYFIENQRYFLETRNPQTDQAITSVDSRNKSTALHGITEVEQHLLADWMLNLKLQFDNEQVESNNYVGRKQRNVISLYGSVEGPVMKQSRLRMTLRNDVADSRYMGCFPTLSYSCTLPEPLGMSFNVGGSYNYRNPSLNDLYWYPGGNENLLPERGKSVDFILKYNRLDDKNMFEVSSGIYFSRVEDWIQWVPTSYRFWVPQNVSLVCARGIEIHVNSKFGVDKTNISASANYVYTHTTDESELAFSNGTQGEQLIYIPKHHANMYVEARLSRFKLAYTLEATGMRRTTYANCDYFTYDLPCYVLHHVSLGAQIKKFALELRCNNLTDKDYQNVIWRAMPGRSWEASVAFKL